MVLLASELGYSGCFGGVASARLKGRVTAGTVSRYSWEDSVSLPTRESVAGARVVFYALKSATSCTEAAKRSPQPQAWTTTDSDGVFDVKRYYTGVVGGSEVELLLCVNHPEYKPFQYEAIVGKSSDPLYGEKFLDIQLERK